ncbi:MAG: Wadjet anti-phage system protein JetD domain-containing protein [Chloroflexota bacterium]
MDISFKPSPDVVILLHALLDKLEQRSKGDSGSELGNLQPRPHAIRVALEEIDLPGYYSQTDPEPRSVTNGQLQELAHYGLISLTWLPGETGHLLDYVTLDKQQHAAVYNLLSREPLASRRSQLETLLLADRFRFPRDDWRSRVVQHVLNQIQTGKSVSPFSLVDAGWNLDLLSILAALPDLKTETPYRVFSVQVFNDSKRFDELKPALIRLARLSNPQWKSLSSEELLGELNLAANPTYIHCSGNWQFTMANGEVLSLGGFAPSVGFPAAQVDSIQVVDIYARAVLCIENLTAFHEFSRLQGDFQLKTGYETGNFSDCATLCIMGNPSPAIRRILRLIPDSIPLYLWSDLDYGGFNILSQLRRHVSPRLQPYLMDITTFDAYAHLSRPLTHNDERNLRQLLSRPELKDVRPVLEHILKRGLKLEQEALYLKHQTATDVYPFTNKTH